MSNIAYIAPAGWAISFACPECGHMHEWPLGECEAEDLPQGAVTAIECERCGGLSDYEVDRV